MASFSRRKFAFGSAASAFAQTSTKNLPNILWITCEDMGPQMGCYGDRFARTPVLDGLAARGARYTKVWSNAPVCAPARTTIISGMYPPSTGSEHMRSLVRLPASMRMFPCYLRDAGYYATNNSKEDYNLENTGKVWDESSPKAHWRNRAEGQPFFAVFNNTITHESQIRKKPHTLKQDPAEVRVPAYHPDTPEVRHDWTQYYDNIATMDTQSGQILKQLEEDKLADSTIVFFYGDHGAGMPRSKRWPYNSGLHVPLLVYVPDKYKRLAPEGYGPGKTIDRLVAFVDLAPTLLSIAGVKAPPYLQGSAFMGEHAAPARKLNFGFRGRMDERIDMVRSCRDDRYVYIRNFMPHRIYGQHIGYMFEMPTAQVWKRKFDEGNLTPAQAAFWKTKPPEELYDLESDRDEVKNLAGVPEYRGRLVAMRKAVHDWQLAIRDVGLLPECEVLSRSGSGAPYDVGHDAGKFPIELILETAEMASSLDGAYTDKLMNRLTHEDSAVRYWAALGLQMRGKTAVHSAGKELRTLLQDSAPAPRIAAAETLGLFGTPDDVAESLKVLMQAAPADRNGSAVSILAMNALTVLGGKAKPALETIRSMSAKDPGSPARIQEYPQRLVTTLSKDLPAH